jgi:CRISPR/Cas system endoribonuclease Cas6 (RAMP superfamily)
MRLGGFVGRARYKGKLDPFWPYLKMGEFVHVGKNASFGLGWYEMK